MANIIVIIVLTVVIALALRTIYIKKKKGDGCMGCPYASDCNKKEKCKKSCNH